MLELNNLYNIDCIEGMKEFPDRYFDIAIVDPPYGINISNNIGRRKGDKKSSYKKIEWDNKPPDKKYFDELIRISKNQIIWGANHFIENIKINSSCWLIWDKKFSEDVSFASFEMAYTSFDSVCKKVELSSHQVKRIHPTQKPIKLYEWILNKYGKQGDKIIDTHAGSASSLIACHKMGFDYIGFEIDKEYYEKALQRLNEEKKQLTIFDIGIERE